MSAEGFKWWNLLGNEYVNHHPEVAAGAVAAGVVIAAAAAYRVTSPKIVLGQGHDTDFVPSSKFSVTNVFELVTEFIQGISKDIIGHHYAEYLPLLTFIFVWTMINNLLGNIPGLMPATTSMNLTLAMSVFVFLYYNYQGFKHNGFSYLEHFTGHLHGVLLLFLGPLLFVIETVSHMVRPLTLAIRLRSNINVDSTVHGLFMSLMESLYHFLGEHLGVVGKALGSVLWITVPLPIVALGLLVAVVQAFVFTLLTTIYIGLATAHEEH